ncbi:MAG: RNA 2'-phosphotransferase [Polyangiales bacterium]
MLNDRDISKMTSHALRHEPWLYELEPDDEGWVPLDQLRDALRRKGAHWSALTNEDIAAMVARADKRRHEIAGDRIRALYGHSVPGKLHRTHQAPPEILFHGTAPDRVEVILAQGLLPMRRQYVHLSTDVATAQEVGARKASRPVLLRVRSLDAHAAGERFYVGNEKVWLADRVPPTFLERVTAR